MAGDCSCCRTEDVPPPPPTHDIPNTNSVRHPQLAPTRREDGRKGQMESLSSRGFWRPVGIGLRVSCCAEGPSVVTGRVLSAGPWASHVPSLEFFLCLQNKGVSWVLLQVPWLSTPQHPPIPSLPTLIP